MFSAPLDTNCNNLTGISFGNPLLDAGVLDFSSPLIADFHKACIDTTLVNNLYYDLKGFAYNQNLGFLSFYSALDDFGKFSNRGVTMNTEIAYKVSAFPTFLANGEVGSVVLKGYAFSSGHGWLKFNCEEHPFLDYDTNSCADENYGVKVDLSDYNILSQTYGLMGEAYSENVGVVPMKGVRIKLPFKNISYKPIVSSFKTVSEPYSNGSPVYEFGLKFFDGGVEKTREFYESGFDFCLVFKDERYLDDSNMPIVDENLNCEGHVNNYGLDLNAYSRVQAFNYDSVLNQFTLKDNKRISSLVPSENGEFGLKFVRINAFGQTFLNSLNLDFNFDFPADFYPRLENINSFDACDEDVFADVFNFREGFNYPLTLCANYFRFGSMTDLSVVPFFKSSIVGDFYDGKVFRESIDLDSSEVVEEPVLEVPFGSSGFVSNLFFRLDADYAIPKELANYSLDFDGIYGFQVGSNAFTVKRKLYSLIDSERSDYTPIVAGEIDSKFFKKIKDDTSLSGTDLAGVSNFDSFVTKFRTMNFAENCTIADPCTDPSGGIQNVVYINYGSVFGGSKIYNFQLNGFIGKTVILDGIDLIISTDFFDDEDVIGFVVNNANIYIRNSVTDLRMGLATNKFIFPYDSIEGITSLEQQRYADYYKSLGVSHFNELYFKGLLRSNNCFGCSVADVVVLPSGKVAENVSDAFEAKVKDLLFLRRTPLEYKVTEVVEGRFAYLNCETDEFDGFIRFDQLDSEKLCYLENLNGENLSRSDFRPFVENSRSALFEYESLNLPYFENIIE